MNQKFYIIPEETKLGKDYLTWEERKKNNNEIFKEFVKAWGIGAERYIARESKLGIIPSDEDIVKYANDLTKAKGDSDSKWFKKTSAIHKAWVNFSKAKRFVDADRPWMHMYFDNLVKSRTRIFDDKGKIYISVESDIDPIPKENFIEIKGSEFHKILEGLE